MGSEKLCLSWNKYESNFSVAFQDLRQEKEFFDVTLACKDGQLEAHKVILSSCSTFFRDILKRNPHVHPLLYMKDVKLSHLQAVVDFMYQGKVNVMQKELDSFLALSRELQVKGLNQELPEENSVEEMEPKDCLKLRKSEDLFKSKELGSNPKEEDERSVCNLDMVNKIRMSGWDSNANEEHGKDHREKKEYQEDKRSGELQYEMELYQEAVAQRLYQEAQRNMLTSTAECGLVGFGGQAGRRNFEENRGDDVELGYPVGYHVGNLCSGWNWGKCKFGIKCKWQHRCSKMMPDGVICKDQWHTERQHI